jgi:hypothetical protein
VKNDHIGHIAKPESGRAGAFPPFHVFCELNSGERTNSFEICTAHSKIRGDGVAVPSDVQFVAKAKNTFVCLDCTKFGWISAPNLDIPTENRSYWRRKQRPMHRAEPIPVRDAIGVDKCENVSPRGFHTSVAGGPRTGLVFEQEARGWVTCNKLAGRGFGAIVDDDNFKQHIIKTLCLEAAKAGFQANLLIKVRDYNRDHGY